jgi:hypothetical protein
MASLEARRAKGADPAPKAVADGGKARQGPVRGARHAVVLDRVITTGVCATSEKVDGSGRQSNQKVGGSTFWWVMETVGIEPTSAVA